MNLFFFLVMIMARGKFVLSSQLINVNKPELNLELLLQKLNYFLDGVVDVSKECSITLVTNTSSGGTLENVT